MLQFLPPLKWWVSLQLYHENIAEKYLVRSVPTTFFLDENENVVQKLTGNLSMTILEENLKGKENG